MSGAAKLLGLSWDEAHGIMQFDDRGKNCSMLRLKGCGRSTRPGEDPWRGFDPHGIRCVLPDGECVDDPSTYWQCEALETENPGEYGDKCMMMQQAQIRIALKAASDLVQKTLDQGAPDVTFECWFGNTRWYDFVMKRLMKIRNRLNGDTIQ